MLRRVVQEIPTCSNAFSTLSCPLALIEADGQRRRSVAECQVLGGDAVLAGHASNSISLAPLGTIEKCAIPFARAGSMSR